MALALSLALAWFTPTSALAYSARLRWSPSNSAGTIEYEVYKRPVSGAYGASEPGTPTAGTGGVLSIVVANLDVRTDYAFRVKAVAGSASALSNELRFGYADVAPVVDSDGDGLTDAQEDLNLNRIVDASESDPRRADSDGDGVRDQSDTCEGTAAGAVVSTVGCSCAQVTCANANVCDGTETCSAGVCRPGTPLACNDGNPCTTDACAPATGCTATTIAGCASCTSASQCNDDNPCTVNTCSNGMCAYAAVANGTSCNDGNACNGAETCQSGACRAGTPPACASDGNPCTVETCSATGGCVSAPAADGTTCGDGNACNGAEACRGGVCQAGTPPDCADTSACTTDTCNPTTGCVHTNVADGTGCGTDRGYCGGTDSCRAGVCTQGTPPSCDDRNRCTIDACDDALGRCTHRSTAGCCRTDADCADSDVCTTAERCSRGVCVSSPVVCPDAGQCATSRCDAVRGCTTMPRAEGAACDDGDACTTNDRCASGTCIPGGDRMCPDPGVCAVGRCDPLLGCASDPLPDGTPCDDGDKCTKRDACSGGVCGTGSELAVSAELMTVQRFTARNVRGSRQRLRGRATLPDGATMELDHAGISLQIDDASGRQLYGVDVPGSAFLPQARGTRTRLSIRPDADSKLRRLAIDQRGEDVAVRFTIVGDALIPPESTLVTLRVNGGGGCGRTKTLSCTPGRTGVTCEVP